MPESSLARNGRQHSRGTLENTKPPFFMPRLYFRIDGPYAASGTIGDDEGAIQEVGPQDVGGFSATAWNGIPEVGGYPPTAHSRVKHDGMPAE